jgi:outer membrane protein OmpA-like peptidoglycan-associated protein
MSLILALALSLCHQFISAQADQVSYGEPRKVSRRIANLPSKVSSDISTRDISTEEASGTGFAVFVGAGGGYLSTKPSDGADALEPSRSGMMMQGRAGLTFYNPRLAIDLTAGWIQSRVDGATTDVAGNTRTETESTIMTRAASIDFSPRMRFGRFDLGPVGGVLLGTNANFDESKDGISAPIFLGGKGGVTFEAADLLFRGTLQASTAISIPERSAFMGVAALEIGIPLVRGKTVIREKEINTVRDNYQTETFEVEKVVLKEVPVVKEVVKEVVTFSFDDQVIHFEFDRARLKPESKAFVARLGKYLAGNPASWGTITIDGHTDQRGSEDYNRELSNARVQAVKQVLAAAGVNPERVDTRAFGKSRPIDRGLAEVSHARNRRVEVSFTDVENTKFLRDAINQIRFATIKPATCAGSHCR